MIHKLASLTVLLLITACSSSSPSVHAPDLRGPDLNIADYKAGESRTVVLSNETPIQVQRVGDRLLYRLEGTFSRDSFAQIQQNIASKPMAERRAILKQEIENVFESTQAIGAIAQSSIPEVGYFEIMLPYEPELTRALKTLRIKNREIIVEPLVYNKGEIQEIQALSQEQNEALSIDPRSEHSSYSGLERIGAIEFVKQAEADIGGGVKVDGSSVQIGIADSGITYNHPTFRSQLSGKVRINRIQDFTGDGTVYIHPSAQLTASAVPNGSPNGSEEDLSITADYIESPTVPAMPAGDEFKKVENLKIKVNAEERALLLAPNASGAKFGVIFEERLNSLSDAVDLNANGKKNDLLRVLYFPASGTLPERVYFDSTGTLDFRKSVALRDFNASHDTMRVFAEKIGFAFRDAQLPSKDGTKAIPVRAVSFVGFDPGAHGTHVSGIAAGSKTIANDLATTLARGVAPEAQIAMARVCANNSGCSSNAGVADLAVNGGAEVINMSLGSLSASNDGVGVGETLLNRLVSVRNTAVIVSAGNSGPGRQTVGSPSVARLALSVGATATRSLIRQQYEWPGAGNSSFADPSEDFMLFFSSRGPSANGGFKPNLSAPGTELSSVPFNTASEVRGGLDVYWGTSMAAPTVTGSYALLLDAIKKYNERHPQPQEKLTTDALTLRRVLIESARPFDVTRLDDSSGAKSQGQYTWADQGTGMVDLKSAWRALFALRDSKLPTAVTLGDQPVELDYEVVTSFHAPNSNSYNGTKIVNGTPVFGAGVYLTANDPSRYRSVFIKRSLPELYAAGESAGELTEQLKSTADRFALRTVIYGSNESWLKAGVQESADCMTSPVSDLTVVGQGVAISVVDGVGSYNAFTGSILNLCLDREKISQLPPGDHGALVYAYRKVGAQVSPIASFIVPVFLSVPEKVMAQGSALEVQKKVPSFGVDRHYVMVPPGTSVLKMSLSVPPIKTDANGSVAANEFCSGVELMAYEGQNISKAVEDRTKARAYNCDATLGNGTGAPLLNPKLHELVVTRTNPRSGLWDVHVFGQYRYPMSQYKLRVDYVNGDTSLKGISGDTTALNGSVNWLLKDSSFAAKPETQASDYELVSLNAETKATIAQDESKYIESPLGILRSYPEKVISVSILTGQSPENDIDVYVMECPADAQNPTDTRCSLAGSGTGSTDEEKVFIVPRAGSKYAVRIEGATIRNGNGSFVSTEILNFAPEKGKVEIKGAAPRFDVSFAFSPESSILLKHPLFTQGKYYATGALSIRMADQTTLSSLPVKIVSSSAVPVPASH
ncbi:MAG: S8 family serine peptidase [Bdellovibrionia bacterium]